MRIRHHITALLFTLASVVCHAAVDANSASEADLDSIKGIGPGTSGKLLEQRKTGKFKDWTDLIARVPGIGEKRAARLSAQGLTVNGAPYSAAAKEPAAQPRATPVKP